jgi:hypothetical protein
VGKKFSDRAGAGKFLPSVNFQNLADTIPNIFSAYNLSASMPGERILGFCIMCGAQNPEKNRFCPGCGTSLVVTGESTATAPAPGTTGTQTAEKNPLTTLLIAGGAIVILLIAALFLSGFFASLFTQTVVGTYRQSGDTLGLALSEITVNADGTFRGGLLSRGTWNVEGNRLKVTYTETRLIRKSCTDAIIPGLCPVETYQVPSGTVKYWTIGWNTLTQDGVVWHKGETGTLGLWRNY